MREMSDCEAICKRFAGAYYRDRAFRRACDQASWHNVWPVIDRDGDLTGEVCDGDDGYLNVDDEAMITIGEAKAGRWQIDEDEVNADEPAMVEVEIATANEIIRNVLDLSMDDSYLVERACAEYHRAAAAFIDGDRRGRYLTTVAPKGRRVLASQWNGAHFDYRSGAIGVMCRGIRVDECDVISEADDAGRKAAAKVVEMFASAEGE